ncbi:hypothetical protein [Methanobacterium oryzae]
MSDLGRNFTKSTKTAIIPIPSVLRFFEEGNLNPDLEDGIS